MGGISKLGWLMELVKHAMFWLCVFHMPAVIIKSSNPSFISA
jgi:hypothetical protein